MSLSPVIEFSQGILIISGSPLCFIQLVSIGFSIKTGYGLSANKTSNNISRSGFGMTLWSMVFAGTFELKKNL